MSRQRKPPASVRANAQAPTAPHPRQLRRLGRKVYEGPIGPWIDYFECFGPPTRRAAARDAARAVRRSWLQRWYQRFHDRQLARRDWIPFGDLAGRLHESGAGWDSAREQVALALRDGWFDRTPTRCAAWVIDAEHMFITRAGPWLLSGGLTIPRRLFEATWGPRDLVLRWCSNCSIEPRPVWRDAPCLPPSEKRAVIGQDAVRLRLMRFDRLGEEGKRTALAPRRVTERADVDRWALEWCLVEAARKGFRPGRTTLEKALRTEFEIKGARTRAETILAQFAQRHSEFPPREKGRPSKIAGK